MSFYTKAEDKAIGQGSLSLLSPKLVDRLGHNDQGSLDRGLGLPLKATEGGVEPRVEVDEKYCDFGVVRLSRVRFALESEWIGLQELRDLYRAWVEFDEGLVLQTTDPITFAKTTVGVKCAKRGNDVYKWRIRNRLRELEELASLKDIRFFDKRDSNPSTKCLFVTFTYDRKRCSMKGAWEGVGVEYNRAISWLKRRYGSISVFRAWESFENGYPHVHAVIFFKDKSFKVFYDKANEARIQEKGDLEGSWHSFIDVSAVDSLGRGIRYLVKYLSKVHNSEEVKHQTTLATMWLYRKRAFGLSGSFVKDLENYRLEAGLHISNKKRIQMTLEGVPIRKSKWVFVGICSWKEVLELREDSKPDLWTYNLRGVPKSLTICPWGR